MLRLLQELQEDARTTAQAQAQQASQDLRLKEQESAEDAYKREMARVADAAYKFKQAEAQQVCHEPSRTALTDLQAKERRAYSKPAPMAVV